LCKHSRRVVPEFRPGDDRLANTTRVALREPTRDAFEVVSVPTRQQSDVVVFLVAFRRVEALLADDARVLVNDRCHVPPFVSSRKRRHLCLIKEFDAIATSPNTLLEVQQPLVIVEKTLVDGAQKIAQSLALVHIWDVSEQCVQVLLDGNAS